MSQLLRFTKDGSVVHRATGKVLGGWRKEGDPHYAAGSYRIWKVGQSPEEGRLCFPRYLAITVLRDAVAEAEAAPDTDLTAEGCRGL